MDKLKIRLALLDKGDLGELAIERINKLEKENEDLTNQLKNQKLYNSNIDLIQRNNIEINLKSFVDKLKNHYKNSPSVKSTIDKELNLYLNQTNFCNFLNGGLVVEDLIKDLEGISKYHLEDNSESGYISIVIDYKSIAEGLFNRGYRKVEFSK